MQEETTVESIKKEIGKLETKLSETKSNINRIEKKHREESKESLVVRLQELRKRASCIDWEIGVLNKRMFEIKGIA